MSAARRPVLFLSSTTRDLQEFRKVARHVCGRLGADVDISAMEEFGPDPREPVELCRQKVEAADLFLGLYAHRYGQIPDGFGKSITELEYDWARACGIPTLLFVIDEKLPWPSNLIDHGASWEQLRAFINRVRTSNATGALTTPDQLKEDLFVYLPPFLAQAPVAVAPRLSPVPAAPAPYIAHRYTLLQTSRIIGREKELGQLSTWAGEINSRPLLALVAIGGMGKSALTWEWFNEQAPQALGPLAGRIWWSFYESDAGFDRFIVAALAYCSGQSIDKVERLSPRDREEQLLWLLDREPFLLVLDGLERILRAYARLDFAHLPDEELDRSTNHAVLRPGGSPHNEDVLVSRHPLRQTIDPKADEFLRKLTRMQASRTLITTRLFPSKLATDTDHLLPGCRVLPLNGLQPDDALVLWRAMGVSGDEADLQPLFISIDYYPLLIRALAGEVAGYRPAPGNLAAWRRAHPNFDPFALPLVQAKSHVLAYALGGLSPDARDVLHTLAAFRAPVDYQTLDALFAQRREWPGQRLDGVLTDLEDRGLLGWDRAANRYDLHPVVRGVVWSGLDDIGRRALYGRLEEHFSSGPAASAEVQSVAEALPMIELMRVLIGLGRYDDAADLFFDRLSYWKPGFALAGMGHDLLTLMEGLFPEGVEAPPAAAIRRDKDVVAELGHAYENVGQLSDAYRCAMRLIDYQLQSMYAVIGPFNFDYESLSERARQLGYLSVARQQAHEAIRFKYSQRNWAFDQMALCEATIGNYDTALRLLAREADEYYDPRLSASRIWLWMGDFARAAELGKQLLEPGIQVDESKKLVLRVEMAEADLYLGHVQEAIDALTDILREVRSMSLAEVELSCLCCLAGGLARRGDYTAAREYLDELEEPAARGPYRLIQADAANIRALLPDAGPAQRRASAEDAYRLAWCDGPQYTYHRALTRAERTLRQIGAPLPRVALSPTV
jgi:hypothetical protein